MIALPRTDGRTDGAGGGGGDVAGASLVVDVVPVRLAADAGVGGVGDALDALVDTLVDVLVGALVAVDGVVLVERFSAGFLQVLTLL